jgi:hypothetical protein
LRETEDAPPYLGGGDHDTVKRRRSRAHGEVSAVD